MNDNLKYSPLQVKILRLIAFKDYSSRELFDKMKLKGFKEEEIEEALAPFIQKGWINDLRSARNLIQAYESKKGALWIKQKLSARKFSFQTIEEAMELEREEKNQKNPKEVYKELKHKLELKYNIDNWQILEYSLKTKIYGYLARNGYSNAGQILGFFAVWDEM
jgi:SOS response regulatory protein OraA/RecX